MKNLNKWSCVVIGLLTLCSCGVREGLAPVVEPRWRAANTHATRHVVVAGETLYAIAFRFDQDYRQLAALNHLPSPYTVRVGQVLRLQSASGSINVARPVYTPPPRYIKPAWHTTTVPSRKTPVTTRSKRQSSGWLWPAQGRLAATYVPQQGKKGIDIAGKKGDKIRAASSGTVAYAGSGLKGYGNLIIIKHDNQYLTAYGNNLHNLVREGQFIKAGQVIADMGVVDRRYWGVHFEIRQAGKPVNPLIYLQRG